MSVRKTRSSDNHGTEHSVLLKKNNNNKSVPTVIYQRNTVPGYKYIYLIIHTHVSLKHRLCKMPYNIAFSLINFVIKHCINIKMYSSGVARLESNLTKHIQWNKGKNSN